MTYLNKYELTMLEWYERLAKAEKSLAESIECNKRFGDNEDWIVEDTAKVRDIERQIEEVKEIIKQNNFEVDYEKAYNLAFSTTNNKCVCNR